jgi:hypothetical protein
MTALQKFNLDFDFSTGILGRLTDNFGSTLLSSMLHVANGLCHPRKESKCGNA